MTRQISLSSLVCTVKRDLVHLPFWGLCVTSSLRVSVQRCVSRYPFTKVFLNFLTQAVFSFLQPHVIHLSGTYRENGNAASVRTSFAPALLHRLPPSLMFSLSRKLFRRRLEVASLELHVGQQPHLKLELTSPTIFGMGSIDSAQMQVDPSKPPSTSGMKFGTTHKTFGLQFESIIPKLFGEWGITFTELALRFKVGFEYGFAGFNWVFTGSWSSQTTELSVVTHFSGMGIVSELESVLILYQWMSTELSTVLALPTWSNGCLCRLC